MKISISVPTRKRIQKLSAMLESVVNTTDELDKLEMSFGVDDDDLETQTFVKNYTKIKSIITICKPKPLNFVKDIIDPIYRKCTGDLVLGVGDDVILKTKGWDTVVRQKFNDCPDKILLVFGNDMHQKGNLATHPILHRNWLNTLGYFVPIYFNYWYSDTWIDHIARMIGRSCYLPDVIFEHMHCDAGKGIADETANLIHDRVKTDHKMWTDTYEIRLKEAQKLQDFINNYGREEVQ